MSIYKIKRVQKNSNDFIAHSGKKGMKWGYNDGKANGKRTASDIEEGSANNPKEIGAPNDPDSYMPNDVRERLYDEMNRMRNEGIVGDQTLTVQGEDGKYYKSTFHLMTQEERAELNNRIEKAPPVIGKSLSSNIRIKRSITKPYDKTK